MRNFFLFLLVGTVLISCSRATDSAFQRPANNLLVATPDNKVYNLTCFNKIKAAKGVLSAADAAGCAVDPATQLTSYADATKDQRNLYTYAYNWYYATNLANYSWNNVSSFCGVYFGTSNGCLGMNNYSYQYPTTNTCNSNVTYSYWYTSYKPACSWSYNNNGYNYPYNYYGNGNSNNGWYFVRSN